jgi:ClpP class serine protease
LESLKASTSKAIAVSINSPGGLPAQADIISSKLQTFSKKHHLPLLTFAESICASAGYYILCAGDQSYADKTSLVGSIGTISMLFRFR